MGLTDLFKPKTTDLVVEFRDLKTSLAQRYDIAESIESAFKYKTETFDLANGVSLRIPKKETKKVIKALRKEFGSKSKFCGLHARVGNMYAIPESFSTLLNKNDIFEHKIIQTSKKILSLAGLANASLWNLNVVGADNANKYTTGTGAVVAVIDSGCNYNHVEIRDNFTHQKGFNFVHYNDDPNDDNGHGTHVAGTVAGKGTGIAPDVQLYAVKVLSASGNGYESDVIRGVEWAIKKGVDVINLSLGSPNPSNLEAQVIQAAISRGIFVAAAAGNDAYGASYPASYPGVTSVAAVDGDLEHADFSNIWETVDISAPGVGVYSCYGDGYTTLSGTSMACPHVAGTAALCSAIADYDNQSIESIIKETAQKVGDTQDPDYQDMYGAGLLRADKVVKLIAGQMRRYNHE